jgi:hypothetical protein
MEPIDKSTFMLYNTISELQFADKKRNDLAFLYQMGQTVPRCLMDRGKEHGLFLDHYRTKMPLCNECIENRGGNELGCEPVRSCPHPEYSKYYMNEFLLVPCPKPTYRNHGVCGEEKCCSKRHQLFKNWTKRKDLV